jgi:hypothetical protein
MLEYNYMTERIEDTDDQPLGTKIGTIICGNWDKLPGETSEERTALGNAAKQELKKTARRAIEAAGRSMIMPRGADVVVDGEERASWDLIVVPPFTQAEYQQSVTLAHRISADWRVQTSVMAGTLTPHIDTLVIEEKLIRG